MSCQLYIIQYHSLYSLIIISFSLHSKYCLGIFIEPDVRIFFFFAVSINFSKEHFFQKKISIFFACAHLCASTAGIPITNHICLITLWHALYISPFYIYNHIFITYLMTNYPSTHASCCGTIKLSLSTCMQHWKQFRIIFRTDLRPSVHLSANSLNKRWKVLEMFWHAWRTLLKGDAGIVAFLHKQIPSI